MKFCFKSAIFGMVFGFGLFAAMGAANFQAAGNGRFQAAGARNHLIIVDTKTGKAWTKFVRDTSGSTSKGFMDEKGR